ncbi:MAG: hypothetical protein ABFD07_02195 [Methanobacterium sp.]
MISDEFISGNISMLVLSSCVTKDGNINFSRAVEILNASIYSTMAMMEVDPLRQQEYLDTIMNKLKVSMEETIEIGKEYVRKRTDPSLN